MARRPLSNSKPWKADHGTKEAETTDKSDGISGSIPEEGVSIVAMQRREQITGVASYLNPPFAVPPILESSPPTLEASVPYSRLSYLPDAYEAGRSSYITSAMDTAGSPTAFLGPTLGSAANLPSPSVLVDLLSGGHPSHFWTAARPDGSAAHLQDASFLSYLQQANMLHHPSTSQLAQYMNMFQLPSHPTQLIGSVSAHPMFQSASGAEDRLVSNDSPSQLRGSVATIDNAAHLHQESATDCGESSSESNTDPTTSSRGFGTGDISGAGSGSAQQGKKGKYAKRDKNRPRRPLSAYNLFFQDERAKMLALQSKSETLATSSEHVGSDEVVAESESSHSSKKLPRHKLQGKIGFETMAKKIGELWKNIDPLRLAEYQIRAENDKQRYQVELSAYMERHKESLEAAREKLEQTVTQETRAEYLAKSSSAKKRKRKSASAKGGDSDA